MSSIFRTYRAITHDHNRTSHTLTIREEEYLPEEALLNRINLLLGLRAPFRQHRCLRSTPSTVDSLCISTPTARRFIKPRLSVRAGLYVYIQMNARQDRKRPSLNENSLCGEITAVTGSNTILMYFYRSASDLFQLPLINTPHCAHLKVCGGGGQTNFIKGG